AVVNVVDLDFYVRRCSINSSDTSTVKLLVFGEAGSENGVTFGDLCESNGGVLAESVVEVSQLAKMRGSVDLELETTIGKDSSDFNVAVIARTLVEIDVRSLLGNLFLGAGLDIVCPEAFAGSLCG